MTFLGLIAIPAAGYMLWQTFKPSPTLDELIKQGKYDSAITILEKRVGKKSSTKADRDKLNDAYIKLAKKYDNEHRWTDALKVLKKVSKGSKQYNEAASLKKNYQQKITDAMNK